MALDRRTGLMVVALLVAAAGVGIGAGALLGGRQSTSGRPDEAALTGSAPASPTAAGGLTRRRAATKIPAPPPADIPVYVLGGTGNGPRLYREFRTGDRTDPVRAAVTGLAAVPADPDYRSPWEGVSAQVSRSGATVTVRFARAPAPLAGEAGMAVQQVVYTVTAADTKVSRVRVIAPGLPAALTATALGRADQLSVLAPVWLLDPVEGGVAGSAMTVSGTASVFEATVSVEVRRGSAVIARTTATASTGAPGRGDWSTTISVPPGDYVVAAYEASEKDGSPPLGLDTKRVTVSGR
jgi:hypothetical protein